ncbi:hypothetical protein M758_9G149000 [Ceratodon purpureus]|nr:hypothetical protein M758_9G149000 [Ceratodon purpureus]
MEDHYCYTITSDELELLLSRNIWLNYLLDLLLVQTMNHHRTAESRVRKLDRMFFQAAKTDTLRTGLVTRFLKCLIYSALIVHLLTFFISNNRMTTLRVHDQAVQYVERIIALFSDVVPASGPEFAYNALVSAVLLSVVLQYLIGYVDRGGTKTYNSGSLEFRATFVSLLLFRGAYVWIKFRDVAPKRAVYRRSRKDENGGFQYYGKYEPRFKPPREKDSLKFNCLPLGGYDTHKDAEVACQIAGFYYGKDDGKVDLEDGSHFSIPPMSEQERSLCGEEKKDWVSAKVKEVFKELKEYAARRPPSSDGLDTNAGNQVDARGFSSSADQDVLAFPTDSTNCDYDLAEFLSEVLAEDYDPTMCFDPGNSLISDDDLAVFQEGLEVAIPTMQENLNQQLNMQKEQLEAEFNRRLVEQHQQHRRLEEENSELRQENKRLKAMLQQVVKPLQSYFATSTEV